MREWIPDELGADEHNLELAQKYLQEAGFKRQGGRLIAPVMMGSLFNRRGLGTRHLLPTLRSASLGDQNGMVPLHHTPHR